MKESSNMLYNKEVKIKNRLTRFVLTNNGRFKSQPERNRLKKKAVDYQHEIYRTVIYEDFITICKLYGSQLGYSVLCHELGYLPYQYKECKMQLRYIKSYIDRFLSEMPHEKLEYIDFDGKIEEITKFNPVAWNKRNVMIFDTLYKVKHRLELDYRNFKRRTKVKKP